MDIIAVTETWIDINSKNFLSEFKIEEYDLFHEDRNGRRGGEVAIYVKTHSDSPLTIQLERTLTQESIWVDILNGREKLVFSLQYRPPNLRREDTNSLLQEISRACMNKNVCFLGRIQFPKDRLGRSSR